MKVDKSFTFDHTLETLDGNLWKALLKCKKLLYLRILNVSFNRQPYTKPFIDHLSRSSIHGQCR